MGQRLIDLIVRRLSPIHNPTCTAGV
jgi:hypothetical protein